MLVGELIPWVLQGCSCIPGAVCQPQTRPQECASVQEYVMLWHVENDVNVTGKIYQIHEWLYRRNIDCDWLE
jgi:hypothetical protein